MTNRAKGDFTLTPRQSQVLALRRYGLTYRAIADQLGVSHVYIRRVVKRAETLEADRLRVEALAAARIRLADGR